MLSDLMPEVVLLPFLRKRSGNMAQNLLKSRFSQDFVTRKVLDHAGLNGVVRSETGGSIRAASAHAHCKCGSKLRKLYVVAMISRL